MKIAHDEYSFLRRRAGQLIKEGNRAAAQRLLWVIDNEQALRFIRAYKLRMGMVRYV